MDAMDDILDAAFRNAGVDVAPSRFGVLSKRARDRLPLGSAEWQSHVAFKLREGFGVEDIAIWLNCHVSHVRTEVDRLRKHGKLSAWWSK